MTERKPNTPRQPEGNVNPDEQPAKPEADRGPIAAPDDAHHRQNKTVVPDPPVNAAPNTRELLAKVPRVTDAEYRITCNDIAEEVAKSWSFLGRVLVAMAVLAAAFIGLVGVTINDMAKEERDSAKDKIDAEIAAQFKDERVKALVEKAADDKAKELLQTYVQPGVDVFNQHLKDQAAAYDKAVADLKTQVDKLTARNEITALADAAEGSGDVKAYRTLREMTLVPNPPDGAMAEFLKVFGTFTNVLGPTIEPPDNVFDVPSIHPGKTKEEDLDAGDLIPLLTNNNMFARMKAGMLLATAGKPGSYATAKAIIDAIKNEPNLWVMRRLKPAFAHVVSYKTLSFQDSGNIYSPDGQNAIDWWAKHEADVKANDSDATSPPTKVPSATN